MVFSVDRKFDVEGSLFEKNYEVVKRQELAHSNLSIQVDSTTTLFLFLILVTHL